MDLKSLILFFVHAESVLGYISGAPVRACDTMQPGHGFGSQTSESPYTITASSETFRCKQDITITLSGTSTFKGFLCQIRPDVNTYTTIGKLTSAGAIQTTNNCGTNIASITHTNNDNKTTATFNWRTNTNVTEVYIVCTIVQKYDTLWMKQNSSAITYVEGGDCSPDDDDDDDGFDASSHIAPSALVLLLGCIVLFESS